MKEHITLRAHTRARTGKGGARKTRAAGLCPAVLYGGGIEPRTLQVDPKDVQKLLAKSGENALIDLEIRGSDEKLLETQKVIIRDLQYPPLKNAPCHIDFFHVSSDRKIALTVPLELTGTPSAVEDKTGTLNQQLYEFRIECLPADIPEKIELDTSDMQLGSTFHIENLSLPDAITVLESPDATIVVLTPVHVEEEVAEVAPELEAAEPELVGKEKDEAEKTPSE